jgi:hypothetical protein
MMVVAMMKNPMLINMMTSTGMMNAQMNLVSGFRKHLYRELSKLSTMSLHISTNLRSVVAIVWLCW